MEQELKPKLIQTNFLILPFSLSFTYCDLVLVSAAAVDGVAVVVTLRCRVTMWCTACQTWTSSRLSAQVGPPSPAHRISC